MADGARTLQAIDHRLLGEGIADQSHMAFDVELSAVIGDDTGRLLTSVLEGVEAECGDRRGVLPPEDAEHAAFVVKMVVGLGRMADRCGYVRHGFAAFRWIAAI